MKKTAILSCTMLLSLGAFAQETGGLVLRTPQSTEFYQITSISPNGKWACGVIDGTVLRGFLWNLTSGELKALSTADISTAMSVSDDGIVAGSYTSSDAIEGYAKVETAGYYANGSWHLLPVPSKIGTSAAGATASSISRDGKHIGGAAYIDGRYRPVSWTDGVIKTDYETTKQGAIYDISSDGTMACGWAEHDRTKNRTMVLWTKDGRIELDPKMSGPFFTANKISANMKYVLAYDSVYNVETGKKVTIGVPQTNVSDFNYYSVSNSGTAIGYEDNVPYISKDGVRQRLDTYLTANGTDLTGYSVIRGMAISEDDKTYGMLAYDATGNPISLVVKLGENLTNRQPAGLTALQLDGLKAARVAWNKPIVGGDAVTGYNIYRNGQKVNASPVTELVYIDTPIENGSYEYTVKALYGTTESAASEPASVTIADKALSEPRDFVALQSGINDVRLLWNEPESNLSLMKYPTVGGEVGSIAGQAYSFEGAVRFTKEELAAYKGYKISSVSFRPTSQQKSWTVNFYKVGEESTPFYTETLDASKFHYGVRNDIALSSAVEIPEGSDILMAISVDATGFGGDDALGAIFNVYKAGYTDLVRRPSVENDFYSFYDYAMQSASGAYEYCVTWDMGMLLSNGSESATSVKTYNIYADGKLAATTTDTNYKLLAQADGKHDYSVSAVFNNDQESPKADGSLEVKQNLDVYRNVNDLALNVNYGWLDANWTVPANDDATNITYANGTNVGGNIGSADNQYSYQVAAAYTTEMLRPYEGYSFKSVRFFPLADAEFTFYVKKGNEIVAEKALTRGQDYTIGRWNTINLDTPVKIDRSTQYTLVLDCYDVTAEQAPVGIDDGIPFTNYSDLYSTDDGKNFYPLSSEVDKMGNWMIGLVAASDDVTALPVEGYNVMIDGKKANEELLTEPKFHTSFGATGTHSIRVDVVYAGTVGEKQGEARVFTISDLTSINNAQAAQINITADKTAVRVEGNISTIEAYSLDGKKVAAATGNVLDARNLNKGVYILQVTTADGQTVKAKVNINK